MRTRSPDRRVRTVALLGLLLVAPSSLATQAAPDPTLPLVVIDAGHGGVDPGARGPGGLREKDVALAVARSLAATLRKTEAFEVRLTRDRDSLIPLRERPRMANRWRGSTGRDARPALFLSIHANADRDPGSRGFETYFLSEPKTEEARRVAAFENAAQEYEGSESDEDDPLSLILDDLRRNHYLRESSQWARRIQAHLRAVHPGPDRGVKQGDFRVLDGAFMPAVLVELGFITNSRDASLLADPREQRRIAQQLARAVEDFFQGRGTREE